MIMKSQLTLGAVGVSTLLLAAGIAQAEPKNIILLISDGMGFNAMRATDMYWGQYATFEGFPVELGMTNYEWDGSWDPVQFWTDFNYPNIGATDSASAATAMYTGIKTDGGRILYDAPGENRLTSIAEIAHFRGLATGAVSSVEFSHATPAAVYAHNVSRNNYAEIANEMIYESGLDVILGCGNPDYDNSGQSADPQLDAKYVGGVDTWNDMLDGEVNGLQFVDDKADFDAMADGSMPVPARIIGVPRVYQTLQYNRTGTGTLPYSDPFNADVPTLETFTKVALKALSQDPDGFFLMVEGGAVDWAGHGNWLARSIEEQTDFNNAVQAVIDWVDQYSSWDETLVMVTADHETGHLWGPIEGSFNPMIDNSVGFMPDHSWNSGSHTNQIVPFYARGVMSDLLLDHVDGNDPDAANFWLFSGDYIDNTDLFPVMRAVLATCDGDVTGDSEIGVDDLLAILDTWGENNIITDTNSDGIIDINDLLVVLGAWGACE
jgi:alkaline phosphatase